MRRAPIRVDLDTFHPGRHDLAVRSRYARAGEVLLVTCTRLSPEKELAVDALAALRRAGGAGPAPSVLGDGAETFGWPAATAAFLAAHRAAVTPVTAGRARADAEAA